MANNTVLPQSQQHAERHVKSPFRMTKAAAAVLLSISLVQAGPVAANVLAQSQQELSAEQMSRYRPLVREVQLFSSLDGPALDLELDSDHLANYTLNSSGHIAHSLDDGKHFRYDLLPSVDHLGMMRANVEGTALYDIDIVKARIGFDGHGELNSAELPEGLAFTLGSYFTTVTEAMLKALAKDDRQLLQRLGGQGHAVLNVSAQDATLQIYSVKDPIHKLVHIEMDEDGDSWVGIDDFEWFAASVVDQDTEAFRGSFKVVGVLETYKGSMSEVAIAYLKSIAKSVDKEKLKKNIKQLGRLGEVGMATAKHAAISNAAEARWQVDFHDLPMVGMFLAGDGFTPVFELVGTDNADHIFDAILEIMMTVREHDRTLSPTIVVSDDLYEALYDLWSTAGSNTRQNALLHDNFGRRLPDLFDRGILIGESDLDHDVTPYTINYGLDDWLLNYLAHNSVAFLGGATLGGGIQAGFDMYREYRSSGRLPHQYSERKLHALGMRAGHEALRGGVSAVASLNLMKMGVPSVIAGAVVGAGNSLYSQYRNNTLDFNNPDAVVPAMGRAFTESAVSSAGAVIGGAIGSTIPVPLSRTAGTLTGSLVGHYLYQYVEDNYDYLANQVSQLMPE